MLSTFYANSQYVRTLFQDQMVIYLELDKYV